MKTVPKWKANVKRSLDSAKQGEAKREGMNLLEIGIQDKDTEVKNRNSMKQTHVVIIVMNYESFKKTEKNAS